MNNPCINKERYAAAIACVFRMLRAREKDVVEIHLLFGRMFNCIYNRRQLRKADTQSDRYIRTQCVEESDNDLNVLMDTWCLSKEVRDVVWFLVLSSV